MIRHASRYLVSAIVVFVFYAIFTAIASAQEQSVCRIEVFKESTLKQSGSGAVIGVAEGYAAPPDGYYWGLIATAAHVLESDYGELAGDEFFLKWKNGAVIRVKVEGILARENETDLALLVALVPSDIVPLVLQCDVAADDKIRIIGYPGKLPETTEGRFLRQCDKGKLYFADVFCRAGYSGGICVNEKGQVVGMISGGWRWVDDDDGHSQSTWPTCGGTAKGLIALSESLGVAK